MKSRATFLTWTLLIFAALLPIALLSIYSFGVAKTSVQSLARSENRSTARFTAEVIQQDFDQTLNTLATFSQLPETITSIQSHDPSLVQPRLQAILSSLPRLDRALLADPQGGVWASYPPDATTAGDDVAGMSWFQGVQQNSTPAISDARLRTNGTSPMVVDFVTPVRTADNQLIALIVCHYRLDTLTHWLGGIELGDAGEVFLIDPSGTVAAHPRSAPGNDALAGYDSLPLLSLEASTVHQYADPVTGEQMIGSRAPIQAGNRTWSVVAHQPRSEAFAPVQQLAVRIGFASGILALAAAGLVVVLEGSRKRNHRLNQQLRKHIQDLRNSEETLERERFLVDTLMENIPDHTYFKDRESRFIRVNPAMAKIVNLRDPNDAVGKSDRDFFTSEHAQGALDDEKEILRTGNPMVNREEKETWPDGSETWVSTTKQCLRDKSGVVIGTFGISRDITDRKRAEEALDLKARELVRSNQELEQFAYAASHDLQEPLRMIASYTQLLARRYKDKLDADATEFIEYAVRMQVLINDLLTYSRVGSRGKPFEKIEAGELMRRVKTNLQIALQESKATLNCDPLPSIHCDVTQLTQLFQNLVSNALKFCGNQPPQVHISATLKTYTDPTADQTLAEWVFTIRDNGIGIAPEYFDRIFVIFQRLHSRTEYPGTGIGLAVCKKIVERHGGRIWPESEPGKGTAFHFTIPQSENARSS